MRLSCKLWRGFPLFGGISLKVNSRSHAEFRIIVRGYFTIAVDGAETREKKIPRGIFRSPGRVLCRVIAIIYPHKNIYFTESCKIMINYGKTVVDEIFFNFIKRDIYKNYNFIHV